MLSVLIKLEPIPRRLPKGEEGFHGFPTDAA
jgi:hypothetical protein